MNRTAYVCKRVYDNDTDKNITGYDVRYTTTSGVKPGLDYDILYGDEFYQSRMAELNSGVWTVVEDTTAKTAADAKKVERRDRKVALRAKIQQIEAEIDAANTAVKLRGVLKPLLKMMLREIMKD